MSLWKKIDRIGVQNYPYCLTEEDACIFAKDYKPGGGFTASDDNNDISNFKKEMKHKNTPAWKYKLNAIKKFASDINFIPNLSNYELCGIPPSKLHSHEEYDPRIKQTLEVLKVLNPDINVVELFGIKNNRQSAHTGGSRNIAENYENLVWRGIEVNSNNIILIDDVITSGSQFKACKQMIIENIPTATVYGLFWGKTSWSQPCTDFESVE